MSLTNTKGTGPIQGEISKAFNIERGQCHRHVLFTILFNFVLQKAIRKIIINQNGMVFNRLIQYLAPADDVIISRTETDLQSAVSQLHAEAKGNGNKTKYMSVSRNYKHRLHIPEGNNLQTVRCENVKFHIL
jgi:hypothetical protein